jgi:hypothetical protein
VQLYDRLEPYVTEAEKSTLSSKLQQTEDWLYEDGEDETKGVYIAKLNELKKVRRGSASSWTSLFGHRDMWTLI